MRLSQFEISSIKEAIYNIDENALVYLFGSRTDNNKRGGDIDLLIISQNISVMDVTKIRLQLFDKIGEQKIDIVTAKAKQETPFIKSIISGAIKL